MQPPKALLGLMSHILNEASCLKAHGQSQADRDISSITAMAPSRNIPSSDVDIHDTHARLQEDVPERITC